MLSEKAARGEIHSGDYIVKTIVTTDLVKKIAACYVAEVYDVFTGFKNIAEVIKSKEGKNEGEYLFGFEESYGYLPGTYARDKDAVAAALLACEMAAIYKLRGIGLREALLGLYEKYGCWETAFAAYNAGEAAVDLWLSDDRYSGSGRLTHIPYSETAGYVKKVRCAADSYKKIYGFGNGPGQNTGEGP